MRRNQDVIPISRRYAKKRLDGEVEEGSPGGGRAGKVQFPGLWRESGEAGGVNKASTQTSL